MSPRIPFQLQLDDSSHYDFMAFPTIGHIRNTIQNIFSSTRPTENSLWHGDIDKIKTVTKHSMITRILQWRNILIEHHKNSSIPALTSKITSFPRLVAVLPCHFEAPSSVVSVREELLDSLYDFWSHSQEILDLYKSINKRDDNAVVQVIPVIFAASRTFLPPDQKFRSLFLHQLFEKVIEVAKMYFPVPQSLTSHSNPQTSNDFFSQKQNIYLLMHRADVLKTGLRRFCSDPEEVNTEHPGPNTHVRIKLTMYDLKTYHNSLLKIDSILVDSVIHINDRMLLGNRGDKLDMHNLFNDPKSLYCDENYHCMSPSKIQNAIIKADIHTINSSDPSSSSFTGIETLKQEKINSAINSVIVTLNLNGLFPEQPLKLIDGVKQLHLIKLSQDPESVEKMYLAFSREVKDVNGKGYKVKALSWPLWLIVSTAIIIPLIYCTTRATTGQPSIEDMISTSLSIVTLCVGAALTFVLNTVYKGEELFDVLNNIRKIDTTDEFSERGDKQLSDIIEVLWNSPQSPGFFGGGPNTSYIRSRFPSAGLNSKYPMYYSNLEDIGFGLFESKNGALFLIDPWKNLFEVSIIDHRNVVHVAPRLSEDRNTYQNVSGRTSDAAVRSVLNDQSESVNRRNSDESNGLSVTTTDGSSRRPRPGRIRLGDRNLLSNPTLSLHCIHVEVDAVDVISVPNLKDRPHEMGGGLRVMSKNTAKFHDLYLSRVLPFGCRKRQIGVLVRSMRSEKTWTNIENADIVEMCFGRNLVVEKQRNPPQVLFPDAAEDIETTSSHPVQENPDSINQSNFAMRTTDSITSGLNFLSSYGVE